MLITIYKLNIFLLKLIFYYFRLHAITSKLGIKMISPNFFYFLFFNSKQYLHFFEFVKIQINVIV